LAQSQDDEIIRLDSALAVKSDKPVLGEVVNNRRTSVEQKIHTHCYEVSLSDKVDDIHLGKITRSGKAVKVLERADLVIKISDRCDPS